MADTNATPNGHPFEGLYEFVRTHLLVVNSLIAFSCALVAALDFLAPKLWMLPRITYACTAALATAMLLAAFMPGLAGRIQARFLGSKPSEIPLWRRGGWQFMFVALSAVSIVGFASAAKASQGGILASTFGPVRNLQEQLLSLGADVAAVKAGVEQANAKLDRLADAADPSLAADRCADLECAISNGAHPEAIRKLFAKGAKIPGDPVMQGQLLLWAATSQSAGRLEALDVLIRNGIARDLLIHPHLEDPSALAKPGALNAKRIFDEARLSEQPTARFRKELQGRTEMDRWNSVAGCLLRTSGGVSLMEFAALQGDLELFAHLAAKGDALPGRPLACKWGGARRGGSARAVIGKAGAVTVDAG